MNSNEVDTADAPNWLYRPSFPDAWPKAKLSSLARWINGMAFKDFQFSEAGRPIIKIAEIKNGIAGQTKFTLAEYDKVYLIHKGDLLFSWSGQPETSIDAFWWSGPDGWLNQHVFKVLPNQALVSQDFVYYLLKYLNPNFVAIARNKQTTGLGHVTKADIAAMEVGIPPPEEQKAIVDQIWSVDRKIDLNRQINQTLEQMAQALFQAWFVDFEPVKAKVAALAEGRDPLRAAMSTLSGKTDAELDALPREAFGTLAATAALFPEEMKESTLGLVPKGWMVRPLDTIADYLNGLALQKYPPERPNAWLPVIKISQLKKGDTLGADRASAYLRPEYIVDDGDVVFSWSGSLEVDIWCGGKGALNQHLFKVTSRQYPKWFYYLWTKQHLTHFQATAAGKAVTMGHIQRKHLTEALCVTPPKEALDKMGVLVADLLDATVNYRIQARSLATLRDSLLPKLLSGELAVTPEEAPA